MEFAGIERLKWQLLREDSVTATDREKQAQNGPAHAPSQQQHSLNQVPAGPSTHWPWGRCTWGVTPDCPVL